MPSPARHVSDAWEVKDWADNGSSVSDITPNKKCLSMLMENLTKASSATVPYFIYHILLFVIAKFKLFV